MISLLRGGLAVLLLLSVATNALLRSTSVVAKFSATVLLRRLSISSVRDWFGMAKSNVGAATPPTHCAAVIRTAVAFYGITATLRSAQYEARLRLRDRSNFPVVGGNIPIDGTDSPKRFNLQPREDTMEFGINAVPKYGPFSRPLPEAGVANEHPGDRTLCRNDQSMTLGLPVSVPDR